MYTLEYDVTPTKVQGGWNSVLRVGSGNANASKREDRALNIMYNGSNRYIYAYVTLENSNGVYATGP